MGASYSNQPYAGVNLCFHGSAVASGGPYGGPSCACNEGWRFDWVLFHDQTCTLPENAVLVFLIVSAVVTFSFFSVNAWLMLNERSNRKSAAPVLKAATFGQLYLVANFLMVACIQAQGGWMEGAAVLSMAGGCLTLVYASTLVGILLRPAFGMRPELFRALKRKVDVLFAFLSLSMAGSLIAQAATCRSDPYVYNSAVVAYFFVIMVLAIACPLVVASSCQHLVHVVRASYLSVGTHKTVVDNALKRIERIRLAMIAAAVNSSLFIAPFLLVHLVLGSAPFSWAFLMICQVTQTILMGASTLFMLNKRVGGNSSTVVNTTPRAPPMVMVAVANDAASQQHMASSRIDSAGL